MGIVINPAAGHNQGWKNQEERFSDRVISGFVDARAQSGLEEPGRAIK